jgi:beta-lactamase regulating signal transducer with metallopeptidase domain
MIDHLFQIVINNVLISFILSIFAAVVGITLKRPMLTHLLWLLVFLKLLIPPIIMVSTISNPWIPDVAMSFNSDIKEELTMPQPIAYESKQIFNSSLETKSALVKYGKQWVFFSWLSGSMVLLSWSIFQTFRFHKLLKKESETAPLKIQEIAISSSTYLGLKTVPLIRMTNANISPMVWWAGGKLWLVMPATLIAQMNAAQLQLIISHELAHISRWDYLCRWIEWIACICFWWNPVVWWARRNLRASEEICCDELVLSSIKPEPYIYGDTLIKAIDILLCTPRVQMVMASNFNGGDLLKRRLQLIISKGQNRTKLRWVNACILLAAIILLPLGLMQAKNNDKNELESHLNVVENKLNKTSKKLSEEQSKKAEFIKAYDQFSKNMALNPDYQKTIRYALTNTMVKNFDPLFKKLNISKEEFEEFKNILVDRMMEIQNVVSQYTITASDDEKAIMNQKRNEINNRYKDRINEFLGEKNSAIYVSYLMRVPERSNLDFFLQTVSPEKKISEEQTDTIIDIMYTGRMVVFEKMGPELDMDSSANLTEQNITREIEKYKLVYNKYVEATRGILPDDQVEQYKNHLQRNLEGNESMMKTRLFMKDNK